MLLAKALESQGLEAWADFKDLHPGQQWREELQRAVAEAQWFLILVGAESRATPWQEAEWSAALAGAWADRQKRVLPIVFGRNDPPPFLRNWIALTVNPGTEPATWTSQVIDILRKQEVHANPASREERRKRLDEIREAVEALHEAKTDGQVPPDFQN